MRPRNIFWGTRLRRRRPIRLLLSVASGISMVGGVGLILPSAVGASEAAPLVRVEEAPHLAAGVRMEGPLAPSRPLEIEVILKEQNLAELDSLAASISDPDSSLYRHYLTPARFASMFDPSDQAVAAVDAQLKAIGLVAGPARDDNRLLPIRTDVSTVENAFHIGLRQALVPGRNPGYTYTTPALLPSSLASNVVAIVGLSDLANVEPPTPPPGYLRSLHPLTHAAPSGKASAAVRGASPRVSGPSDCAEADNLASTVAEAGDGYPNTYSVLDGYYDVGPMYSSGFDGTGQTVALFEFGGDFDASDIQTFQACYGSTSTVTREPAIDGGPGPTPAYGETELDIDSVLGAAPQANIDVYEGGPSSTVTVGQSFVDTLAAIVNSPQPAQVVSISYGLCEPAWAGTSYLDAMDSLFEQAAMLGQTVLVASGDSGSEGCQQLVSTDTNLAVNYPASDPWVTAVGGTENADYYLSYNGLPAAPGASEGAWNMGCFEGGGIVRCGGGGGGYSVIYPRPSWQTGPGVDNSAYPNDGREVPDVSANGDLDTGYVVYNSTCGSAGCNGVGDVGWTWVGGTSGAAPLWAGAVALMNQRCAAIHDGPVGFADPALYVDAQQHPSDFFDIPANPSVDGVALGSNNDTTGTNGGAYPTTAGYDMATGLGSPDVSLLSNDLCSPATLSIVTGHVGSFVSGSTGAYTLTVTNPGGPTSGQVTVTDDLPAGETFSSGSGDGFSCSAVGQVVTCLSTTSIVSGTPAVIGLQVKITAAAGAVLSNQASVGPHGGSSNVDQVTVSPAPTTTPSTTTPPTTTPPTTTPPTTTPSTTTPPTSTPSTTSTSTPPVTASADSSSGATPASASASSDSLAVTGPGPGLNWTLLLGTILLVLGSVVRLLLGRHSRRTTSWR